MRFLKKYSIYFLISLMFIIIGIRLYQVSYKKHEFYENQLNLKQNKIITLNSAPRGRILDRNGNILVDNIGVKTIVYHKPNKIKVEEEIQIAKELADILQLDYKESVREYKDFYILINKEKTDSLITDEEYEKFNNRKLTKDDIYEMKLKRITDEMINEMDSQTKKIAHIYSLMNKGYKYEVKTIKGKDVLEDEYAKIIEKNIKGVTGSISWERTYPYGNVLRNIFGNISDSSKGLPSEKKNEYIKKGYSLNDRVGISYLEEYYEEYLKGTKATYKVNSNNTLSLLTKEKKGNDLILAIDINLQMEIERIIQDKIIAGKKQKNTEYYNHAYAIVSDPNDGSIVAMAGQRLNENSNTFSDISTNIINSAYTMGSVVKGASHTVGYQNNLIDIDKNMTDSCVKLYLVPEKCSFKKLGKLNDITALKWSSNYYQFITAIKSTGKTYHYNMKLNTTKDNFQKYRDTFASFGLGVLTGIDLPNEKPGITGTNIADDLLLNLAIGQYDTYTPLELVQYINTIATNGKRTKLSLMQKVVDENNKTLIKNKGNVLNQVQLDNYYFGRIKEGFRQVLDGGTGAGYTDLKFNPAGKTGTSQSFYDSDNDGKVDVQTISMTYAMFAPLDAPKYSLVVISPNVSHTNGNSDHMAYINQHISKEVSQILFENY